ncbi:MAG: hypothetical protein KC486_29040 [Myxococcales bacterium]|nr:hypothetical protein [Myxococcales bacterium]
MNMFVGLGGIAACALLVAAAAGCQGEDDDAGSSEATSATTGSSDASTGAGSTGDAGTSAATGTSTSTGASTGESESDSGATSTDTDATGSDSDTDTTGGGEPARLWGRFESGGPITSCGMIKDDWSADDGPLMRMSLDLCGDDMAALAETIADNLDAVEARGGRALLILNQGINLPAGWLAQCETYALNSGNFTGDLCVPWDPNYQASLAAALSEHVGPAVAGHPALAAVYFTISTMTNGAEMHFRVLRDDFTAFPDEEAFTASYLAVMDAYQAAFDVPILFEAGHCIFDLPQADEADIDCETPLALYRHARDNYGVESVGLGLWNCAERFFHGPEAIEDHVRPLLEEATADGASMGCQTVGNFTEQPCRFSDPAVGDYGELMGMGKDAVCIPAGGDDAEAACVDTLRWFSGAEAQSATSVMVQGTWLESWSADTDPVDGIIATSDACREAVDQFKQPAP